MLLRDFRIGDEPALHAVFLSAVHGLAAADYTAEQIDAWAPRSLDPEFWSDRMRGISPFVVESAGVPVAYADVQRSGYIDHFFVSAPVARQGVGSMLMNRIHEAARDARIDRLSSDVSVTAQPFFEHFGFSIVERRAPVRRGVIVPNARMEKRL